MRGGLIVAKWNNIPFDENASPEEKALEFDLQVAENGGDPNPKPQAEGNWNPYGNLQERRK
jgi:hypothetical protein